MLPQRVRDSVETWEKDNAADWRKTALLVEGKAGRRNLKMYIRRR